MQPSVSTTTRPNGAPAGSGTWSTGAGAAACSSCKASRSSARLPPIGRKLAAGIRPAGRGFEQARLDRVGVVVEHELEPALAVAEPAEHRLGIGELRLEAGELVPPSRRHQNQQPLGAVGQSAKDRVQAELGHLVERERDHARRQAAAEAADQRDHLAAVRFVMDQQRRVLAAALPVGEQKRAQALEDRGRRRIGVGRGTGRADAVAGAAAAAEIGVDRDHVAGRLDRGRRADLEAAGAAGAPRARMGAELGLELDVARLLELADQIGQIEQRALDRRGIAGVGLEIAVALGVRREQGRCAAEIEDQIEAGRDPVPRPLEGERIARRGDRLGKAVEGQLERAEMARGAWRPCRGRSASPSCAAGSPRRPRSGSPSPTAARRAALPASSACSSRP